MVILDAHGEELLETYKQHLPTFQRLDQIVTERLSQALREQGLYVTAVEHRIKTEKSLIGKLELKGAKYHTLHDITDILGVRIITFYTDEVDKVAAIVKQLFEVDWNDSVDKRKAHELTSFGYTSLHYICRLPKKLAQDPDFPDLDKFRFEVQMRTALQHAWSTIEHDIGYKTAVHLPSEYRRQFSRLAGLLELADDEFSRLRKNMTDYSRKVQTLVKSGKLGEVPLNRDTFRDYLQLNPFDRLNQRIAAVNQAEIFPAPLMPYLRVLEMLHMETLGDVDNFISENTEDAFQLALSQLAITDLDILSETIGVQNLCIVCILKQGGGRPGLRQFYDIINGERDSNDILADAMLQQALTLPFMNEKKV